MKLMPEGDESSGCRPPYKSPIVGTYVWILRLTHPGYEGPARANS